MEKLSREFYTRNTLVVARALLGKYLIHRLPTGVTRCGRIVDTEAYAGFYDRGSHTYQKKQKSDRTQIWYEDGGYAYVYSIYGSYVCLGLTTEVRGISGAVLIRSLELVDGFDPFLSNNGKKEHKQGKPYQIYSGPSKLCIAMQINKQCNGLDLCGEELYVEQDTEEDLRVEDMVFAPRINIDYAEVGALSAWRYYLRTNPAVSNKNYEPLRQWRTKGYPSLHQQQSPDLFSHLAQREEHITMEREERKQIEALPKIELHLHLEGCVTSRTLRTLCEKNHQRFPPHLQDGEAHQFGTFAEFAYSYHRICQAIVHEQDLALVIADVAAYLKRNNILYAELSWTPFLYLNKGFRFDAAMEVMNEALVTHHVAERVNFIIDVQRDHGLESGSYVYQHVFAAHKDLHIAGVGLTGQEEGFSPSDYHILYQQAREQGLGTTAHAGEYGTADDIWQCIRTLNVSRIGHGVHATDDRSLLDTLIEQHIHVETCPTSNVRLGRVMTYSGHPVQVFRQKHLSFSLNSDDPGLFASDLSDEYLKVMEHCGFSLFDIRKTLEQSVVAAFLPPERKQVLQQQIDHDWRSLC